MQSDNFSFDELFIKFRTPLLILLVGLILVGLGVLFYKKDVLAPTTKVEVLNGSTESLSGKEITTEIAGSVLKPGVYKMGSDARVNDLILVSGGLSGNADRTWVEKYVNKASKLTDGQKIYIPQSGETSANNGGVDQSGSSIILGQNTKLVNINTGSLKELDSLPGIGPTYAQNIIDHRPYSTLDELVSKGAIKQSLLDKIKDKVTTY